MTLQEYTTTNGKQETVITMTENKKYKGIIFDFNGTLFWDSKKHLEAWREYSKKLRGHAFTDEEMQKYMFGRTNEDIIKYLIGKQPDRELVLKCQTEKEAIYRDMCAHDPENFKLARGAEEFLTYLCENEIPHTIATMSEEVNVKFFIKGFSLDRWFDVSKIVFDDGKIKGKPEPDIYLKAAQNLGLQPEDCIVVEDAVSGIESAYRAGIGRIVAIESMETRELYSTIPAVDYIISDFNDFDRNLLESKLNKVL